KYNTSVKIYLSKSKITDLKNYLKITKYTKKLLNYSNVSKSNSLLYTSAHAEAAVSECRTCVAYFKRRWTNVTNVKKLNSRPAQKCSGPPGTLPLLPITHP